MKRCLLLGCVLIAVVAAEARATRTLFRSNVRISRITYRSVTETESRDWYAPVTEAAFSPSTTDTVRFMPVMPNPRTVQPDTINYRGTAVDIACVKGSVVVRPFGPYFRPGLRISLSASSDSVLYRWRSSTLIDSLWVWGVGGNARCVAHAH